VWKNIRKMTAKPPYKVGMSSKDFFEN